VPGLPGDVLSIEELGVTLWPRPSYAQGRNYSIHFTSFGLDTDFFKSKAGIEAFRRLVVWFIANVDVSRSVVCGYLPKDKLKSLPTVPAPLNTRIDHQSPNVIRARFAITIIWRAVQDKADYLIVTVDGMSAKCLIEARLGYGVRIACEILVLVIKQAKIDDII
jgi:hypothetical protein